MKTFLGYNDKIKKTVKEQEEFFEILSKKDKSLEELVKENQRLREENKKTRKNHERTRNYRVDSLDDRLCLFIS